MLSSNEWKIALELRGADNMRTGDVAPVSLLVLLLVGTMTGGSVGLLLGRSIEPGAILALVAGLLATIAAVAVRNGLVQRQIGVGSGEEPIPIEVLTYGLIGAIAGSLGGLELAQLLHEAIAVWVGLMSGLLSSLLMGLLLITYHTP
jgi:hypothetical protein